MSDSPLATIGKVAALALAVVLVVGAVWYFTGASLPTFAPQPVVCAADAMQCPDGSWVGRTGQNCEFVCPIVSTTYGTTTPGGAFAEYHSGVKGTVMGGPTCPVVRTPPDPACADKPLEVVVSVFRQSDSLHVMATASTDAQGAFKLSLPPGDYIVSAGTPHQPLPRCTAVHVTAPTSSYAGITINCDTGIR